jgi:hypothetical protein
MPQDEYEIFTRMDAEEEWPLGLVTMDETPSWLLFTKEEVQRG